MRLKKLIVHGFKSFADRVEVIFEDGITGVVGPNGCGKSNIADAIKWVLGEQSAKQLRGTKMEDVIFNGTEKRKRLAFCEVTLIFDNTDHALPIEFTEVSVTRRVYRSGEGEYKINGAACRLRDIVDLFRDTGIGKDGYSMIGQGRIDEILSVKSEDRRQVFEEAAGIVKYKVRKQDAQRRMDNTTANLNRVEDILSELTERVEPLKKQSEEAREYLNLRDELKGLDVNVFLLRTERYEIRIRELKQSVETLGEAILNANRELEELGASREECQTALSELELQTAEKRDQVQNLIREVEACEGAVRVMRERISAIEKEKKRLITQREAASMGKQGVLDRIESLGAEIETESADVESAADALSKIESELSEREAALAEMEERSEQMKQQIIQAMNRLGDVRSQRARLSAMKAALENQLSAMAENDARQQAGVESLNAQVAQAQERIAEEKQRREELQNETQQHNLRVQGLNDRLQALSEQVSDLQAQRQTADSRLKLLREMQRDYEGYNNSVKQVLLQARRSGGSGVHGIVADLLRVPQRLERAVDMVLGGSLQNIVVDRDEDAKRMIEYLRANRYGRATFLPIGSVRGRTLTAQERGVLSMPGCVGVASELVEFDPKYQGVIDNLLGRTVIAEDLSSGIAIQRASRYQLRLVTIEGDVMHSGGSMTGGSVQSRMTSLLSRSREIEETEKKLSEISDQLQKLREIYRQLDEERTALKKERGELFEALHQQDVLCARAEETLKAALDEQRANDERVRQVAAERDRLSGQLADVTDTLSGLDDQQQNDQSSNEARQAEVRELQQKIYASRGENEALRNTVTDRRVSIAERRRGLTATRKERERMIAQSEDTDRILSDSEALLQKCESEMADSASALEKDAANLEQQRGLLTAARAEFSEADTRRTGAQKRLQEITESIDQSRTRLDEFSDKHHRSELQLARVESEFKQIQDRIWEDYELTYATAQPLRTPDFKLGESEKRIAEIRQRIRAMGTVNVAAVDEYRRTVERVEEMTSQRDDLIKARCDLEGIIEELEQKMQKQFTEQFALINANFARTFVRLFGGGTAELRLADPKDALNCGIDIVAQPPGKKLQMLSLLSGGERALTAIAILFAILDLKPTPFCVLDEIEAALDDANIDTYADYLKSYSENTQFIVITHRKGTMERCDALYGVVMQEKGVSKTVSVKLNEALQGA